VQRRMSLGADLDWLHNGDLAAPTSPSPSLPLPTIAAAAPDPAAEAAQAAATSGAQHVVVGLNALVCVLLISTALWLGHLIKKLRLHWLSESGAAMLLGVCIGAVVNAAKWNTTHHHLLTFEPELFFFVLLPPIIMDAGYSMERGAFFRSVGTILLFAVCGTLISTLVVGYGLFGLARLGVVGLESSNPLESLIFGSLISAVDPVAVLSLLQSSKLKSPQLLSLIFGESVLNDAVSIVLFNTFRTYYDRTSSTQSSHRPSLFHPGGNTYGAQHAGAVVGGVAEGGRADGGGLGTAALDAAATSSSMSDVSTFNLCLEFLFVSVGSLCIGVLVGLACSLLFRTSRLQSRPEIEFTLVLFFAYASYCLSEILSLSGIMSLFFCSIIMAHYNWYNLSVASRLTTKHAFHSFSLISETFLFAYLGLSSVVSVKTISLEWSPALILATMALCMIGRALHVFPLSFLSNLCTKYARSHGAQFMKLGSGSGPGAGVGGGSFSMASGLSPSSSTNSLSSSNIAESGVMASLERASSASAFFPSHSSRHNSMTGHISLPTSIFVWFSSMRGAVAFALSLNVFTSHRSAIISSTMAIVVMTTVILGGMAAPLLRKLKLVQEDVVEEEGGRRMRTMGRSASGRSTFFSHQQQQRQAYFMRHQRAASSMSAASGNESDRDMEMSPRSPTPSSDLPSIRLDLLSDSQSNGMAINGGVSPAGSDGPHSPPAVAADASSLLTRGRGDGARTSATGVNNSNALPNVVGSDVDVVEDGGTFPSSGVDDPGVGWIGERWRRFDESVMQRFFGGYSQFARDHQRHQQQYGVTHHSRIHYSANHARSKAASRVRSSGAGVGRGSGGSGGSTIGRSSSTRNRTIEECERIPLATASASSQTASEREGSDQSRDDHETRTPAFLSLQQVDMDEDEEDEDVDESNVTHATSSSYSSSPVLQPTRPISMLGSSSATSSSSSSTRLPPTVSSNSRRGHSSTQSDESDEDADEEADKDDDEDSNHSKTLVGNAQGHRSSRRPSN